LATKQLAKKSCCEAVSASITAKQNILLRQAAFALGYEAISEKKLLRSRERKHHGEAERHPITSIYLKVVPSPGL